MGIVALRDNHRAIFQENHRLGTVLRGSSLARAMLCNGDFKLLALEALMGLDAELRAGVCALAA
jgi:hypothetical protein